MDGMIAMLPKPFQALSTHIDFQGQKVAERTYQVKNLVYIIQNQSIFEKNRQFA